MATEPWYTTREAVKAALDVAETARTNLRIDQCIAQASRDAEGILHRRFYPLIATRAFPYPDFGYRPGWKLVLDEFELISVTSLTAAGTAIVAADFFLEPIDGPPYDTVEIDLASSSAFSTGNTFQRQIEITGLWGYANESRSAGTLNEGLDSSETGIDVSNSAAVGVGSIIKIDDERMIVTEKVTITTGQTLQTAMTSSMGMVTVAVTDGSAFIVGETILLDSERMLVVDITANTLHVKRAWDGSTLAAHNGSTIYAPRTLTVERGALGTTAATHSTSAAVSVHVVPPLVEELTLAYALNALLQGAAGYARTSGSGDNESEVIGRGLRVIRQDAWTRHGRKARGSAV